MTIKKIVAIVVLGSLIGCATNGQTPDQPFTFNPAALDLQIGCASCVSRPKQLLTVHAPDADGWSLFGATDNVTLFSKKCPESNESYTAQAITFDMPPTKSNAEFVNYVKQRIAGVNPLTRYQETEANYQYTDSRGYPCVKVHTVFNDNDETFRSFGQSKLQIIGLYCRHPVQKQWGFSAIYTHRGTALDPQLEAPAQSFIDGVTVPNNESKSVPPK